jgi:ribonuclease HI
MDDTVLKKDSYYLGITTNNQAEYQALKEGLEACQALGIGKVHVFMDSLLVVNQMKGIFKVKNRDLWPIHQSIKDYLSNFASVSFTHVPRELNKIADGMVNECLDAQKDASGDGTIG